MLDKGVVKEILKNKNNLYILLVVGILILVVSNLLFSSKPQKEDKATPKAAAYPSVAEAEKRLKEILSKAAGVGNVEVMVTYDTGPEKVTVQNAQSSKTSQEEPQTQGGIRKTDETNSDLQTVMTSEGGQSQPFVSKEIEPKIRGVLVVADGAREESVKIGITNAVAAVLDVPYHRIEVLPKASTK